MIFRFIILSFLFLLTLHAQVIPNDLDYKIEMRLDPTHLLTLKDVREQGKWEAVPDKRLGFIDQTAWFHISIKKHHDLQKEYLLKYNFPNIDDLRAYEFRDNIFSDTHVFGMYYPKEHYFVNYEYFLLPLAFHNTQAIDLYIKVKHFGSIPTSFSIIEEKQFLQINSEDKTLDGLLYGILLVMIFYNLILYLFTRLNYYIYYIALVFSSLLYQLAIRGYAAHHLWPNSPHFAGISDTLFALFFIFFGGLFIFKLLDINIRHHARIFWIISVEIATICILLILTMFFELTHLNDTLGYYINSIVMLPILLLFVTIITSAYYLAILKERTAILFSIAWSLFTLAIIIYVLQIWGALPLASWSNNLLAIGAVSEVVLLALILADKINTLNVEKQALQYTNQELEQIVSKRTAEIKHQLYYDNLTGLKNRISLINQLQHSQNSIVLLIDIDNFSQLNDIYGLDIGNQILEVLSKEVSHLSKVYDFIPYRIGGDEFVLLRQEETSYEIDDIMQIAHTVHNTIETKSFHIETLKESIEIDVTIAVVHHTTHILNKADMTIKNARSTNKTVLLYHESQDKTHQLQKNIYYKKEIRLAMHEDRFVCFFQPIVSANENSQKYELLMRLKQVDAQGDIRYISPFEFLGIAIATKQYEGLSRHVLEKGIRTVAPLSCDLSVNLSFIEIQNPDFKVWFINLLRETNMFQRIVIEILEDEHLKDYNLMKEFCAEFQGYGARIAIDDFGSGFSNFTHILELRPDYIKIDGSIIKNIHTDSHSYALVKAIVFLAKELGSTTIAEFVHNEEVLNIVKELGVDEFQGFHIAEPQPLF